MCHFSKCGIPHGECNTGVCKIEVRYLYEKPSLTTKAPILYAKLNMVHRDEHMLQSKHETVYSRISCTGKLHSIKAD